MSTEVLLYQHLKGNNELKNLISTRIFPLIIPEKSTMPCIVYTVINDKDNASLQGDIYSNDVTVQIDCYSSKYAQVKEVKEAVKEALYKFSYYPHDLNSMDIYEEDTKLHRQSINFKIIS